jgi:hypothetical protein
MRLAVGLLASLSLIGLSQAFATDPPSPAATPPATPSAAPPTTAPSTSTPAPATSAPQASTTTPAAQPAAPAKPELTTAQEKNLISQGYKVETRNGEKYFCKNEAALGTRFTHKHCRSADQILADTQDSKDVTRQVQQGYVPPPPQGPGR